jgi:hypothetical protein
MSEPDLIHPDQLMFTDAVSFLDRVGKYQRTGQSATSRVAAVEAVPLTGSKRADVYALIRSQKDYGATDEEIQTYLDMNPSTQRPRRVELVDAGLIRDSGTTRQTRSGRPAVVWVAA